MVLQPHPSHRAPPQQPPDFPIPHNQRRRRRTPAPEDRAAAAAAAATARAAAGDAEFAEQRARFDRVFPAPAAGAAAPVPRRLFVVGNHDVGLGDVDCPACRARRAPPPTPTPNKHTSARAAGGAVKRSAERCA